MDGVNLECNSSRADPRWMVVLLGGEGWRLCVSTCFAHLLVRTNLMGHRLRMATAFKALHFNLKKILMAALLLLLYNCKSRDWDYDVIMHAVLIGTKWEEPPLFFGCSF